MTHTALQLGHARRQPAALRRELADRHRALRCARESGGRERRRAQARGARPETRLERSLEGDERIRLELGRREFVCGRLLHVRERDAPATKRLVLGNVACVAELLLGRVVEVLRRGGKGAKSYLF